MSIDAIESSYFSSDCYPIHEEESKEKERSFHELISIGNLSLAYQNHALGASLIEKVQANPNHLSSSKCYNIIPCGGRVHGEASIEVGIDSDGNKHAGGKIEAENEEGTASGSASGKVSYDDDGNAKAEAKFEGTFHF